MLNTMSKRPEVVRRTGIPHQSVESAGVENLLAFARRQWLLVVICTLLGAALGVFYLSSSQPLYTASASVLIDSRNVPRVDTSYDPQTGGGIDSSVADSQVEVMLSNNVLLAVIDKLDLTNHPVYSSTGRNAAASTVSEAIGSARELTTSLWNSVRGLTGIEATDEPVPDEAATPAPEAARTDPEAPLELIDSIDPEDKAKLAIMESIRRGLLVSRIRLTYVIEIRYTSPDPQLSANLVNAVANQYLTDQLEAKYEATRRAGSWLSTRIEELKQQSLSADLAVQKYKAENGLISADGRTINEQQLAEINSELVVARTDTSRNEARYNRIRNIIESRQTEAAVSESIGNAVISDLRQKFLEASRQLNELEPRLGSGHVRVVQLRNDMKESQRLIFDELRRIAESYKSDYDIAKQREIALSASLQALVGSNAADNQTLVTLRQLEREATTYKNLYELFLQRYQEAVQQQSFPITDSRVITQAAPPTQKSSPNSMFVMAFAVLIGGTMGVALGFLREFNDRAFRNGTQVRQELDQEFFGVLTKVPVKRLRPAETKLDENGRNRSLRPLSSVYRHAIENPMSGFSETLRSIKLTADISFHDRRSKVIGMVSCLPKEGKTTVSKNLASLIASGGSKTLLIDADLRNPGLTRSIGGDAEEGIIDVLVNNRPVKDVVKIEEDTGLHFLPGVVRRRLFHTSDVLASSGMRDLLAWARTEYDYVIVDLPPLAPVIDVRAVAHEIDGFVFVVAWGLTSRRLVRSILRAEDTVNEKCLGVVLNMADPRRLGKYQNFEDTENYVGNYKSYYYRTSR